MNKFLVAACIGSLEVSNLPKDVREQCVNSLKLFSSDSNISHINEINRLISNNSSIGTPVKNTLLTLVKGCTTDPEELIIEDNNPIIYNNFGITSLKKYDVIKSSLINFGDNKCPHWSVVYKVINGLAYCVTITSKETYGKIKIKNSRMFNMSYFCPAFSIVPEEEALRNYAFIFDNKSEFDRAVKQIKNILK